MSVDTLRPIAVVALPPAGRLVFQVGTRADVDCSKLEEPIILRFSEAQTRGKAIDDFQQAMFAARSFFIEAQNNNTLAREAAEAATPEQPVAPPKYTDEELRVVEDMLKDNEVWMDTRMEKQVQIEEDKTKDPEILTEDLNSRGKRLQSTVSHFYLAARFSARKG